MQILGLILYHKIDTLNFTYIPSANTGTRSTKAKVSQQSTRKLSN